jgi:alkanesulfonate monooxygenase SsuD/methylene tetrahydromethanopterin reductase-like flavin-dependent oxidoreductase (luciferase family)
VIKMLWEATPSSPANYSGEFFSLHGAYLQTRPFQKPMPPVYIGAIGPKTRELAGELAEGWTPMASETPDTLREQLEDVKAGAGRSGRSLDGFEVAVTAYTDVSDDVERTYRTVEATARSMLVWERHILKRRAGLDVPEDYSVQRMDVRNREVTKAADSLTASIPRELVEEITIIGTVDQCIAKIEKYLDAGATSLMIANLSPEQERIFEVYANKIFPYLRENYGITGRK